MYALAMSLGLLPFVHREPDVALQRVLSRSAVEALAREILQQAGGRPSGGNAAVPQDVLVTLSRAMAARYPFSAERLIAQLQDEGLPSERLVRDYFGTAARKVLGQWQDHALTADAAIRAALRLYLSVCAAQRHVAPSAAGGRMVLTSLLGEGDVASLAELAGVLAQRDASMVSLPSVGHDAILATVREEDQVVLCVTETGRRRHAAVLKLVATLRVQDPSQTIVVIGRLADHPADRLTTLGVSAHFASVQQAVLSGL